MLAFIQGMFKVFGDILSQFIPHIPQSIKGKLGIIGFLIFLLMILYISTLVAYNYVGWISFVILIVAVILTLGTIHISNAFEENAAKCQQLNEDLKNNLNRLVNIQNIRDNALILRELSGVFQTFEKYVPREIQEELTKSFKKLKISFGKIDYATSTGLDELKDGYNYLKKNKSKLIDTAVGIVLNDNDSPLG